MRTFGKLAAAIALAVACMMPMTAFADDAVLFDAGDIGSGNQIFMGTYGDELVDGAYEKVPVSWTVGVPYPNAGNPRGKLSVYSTYVLNSYGEAMPVEGVPFAMNTEGTAKYAPDLTLATTNLCKNVLPELWSEIFNETEQAIADQFVLPGNIGAATARPGAFKNTRWVPQSERFDSYWTNDELFKKGSAAAYYAYYIDQDGSKKEDSVILSHGIRPATFLSIEGTVAFVSAAEGGKPSTEPGQFTKLGDASSVNAWKLTLLDSERAVGIIYDESTLSAAEGYESWTVPVTFNGGGFNDNDYYSAILCDAQGNALYYGTIANQKVFGTQDMSIPTGLEVGEYSLRVFSEARNGDEMTDIASDYAIIPLTVTKWTYPDTKTDPPAYVVEAAVNPAASGDEPAGGTVEGTGTYEGGTTATLVAVPGKGFVFASWTANGEVMSTEPTYSFQVTADESLVANFVEAATLTFDLDGGTLEGDAGPIEIVAAVGDTIELPGAPVREGYTFTHWIGSEYEAGAEYVVEGDHEFTAGWEKVVEPEAAPESTPEKSGTSGSKSTMPATGDPFTIGPIGLLALALCALTGIAYARAVLRRRS